MQRFSIFSLLRAGLVGHKNWPRQWRAPDPKPQYDVVIIGGGGHGLATAFYLASRYSISNVAVVERSWIGGGNTGRNTTIIRSNYLFDESARLYEHALKLWERLAQDINYNVMYSPRGVLMLAHNVHDVRIIKQHVHANRLNGIDNEWLSAQECKDFCPPLNLESLRHPILGGALREAARPGMTPSRGAMHVRLTLWGWTLLKIAR